MLEAISITWRDLKACSGGRIELICQPISRLMYQKVLTGFCTSRKAWEHDVSRPTIRPLNGDITHFADVCVYSRYSRQLYRNRRRFFAFQSRQQR